MSVASWLSALQPPFGGNALLGLSFLGLAPGTLALLGAGAFAAVTALYLLTERQRRLVVPFVELFLGAESDDRAVRRARRLRRLLSWLLHLVLVLLLALGASDPRPASETEGGRSIVMVIDATASMTEPARAAAVRPDALAPQRRIDVAKERLGVWFAGLRPADRVLLVTAGRRPVPVASWLPAGAELSRAATSIEVEHTDGDLDEAVRFAAAALGARERASVVVVSDGALGSVTAPPKGIQLMFESVAEGAPGEHADDPPPNVGVSSFSVRRYPLAPARAELLLELANTGLELAEVEVRVVPSARPDAAPLVMRRFRIEPGGRVRHVERDFSAADASLLCRVTRVDGASDALRLDDVARAELAPLRRRRVLVVGRPSTYLDAALLLDDSLDVVTIAASAYPPPEPFDVTIFHGAFPKRAASTGAALYLGAEPAGAADYPLALGRPLEMFGFDRHDKKSPVFRDVDPYDVQVLRGSALLPQAGDQVLGQSGRDAIAVSGARAEGRFIALSFLPEASDLVLRTTWPLLLSNVLSVLAPQTVVDGALSSQSGDQARLELGSATRVVVTGPLGEPGSRDVRVPVIDGRGAVRLERVGSYEVRRADGSASGEQVERLAVNFFSEREVRFGPARQLSLREPSAKAPPAGAGPAAARSASPVAGFEARRAVSPWIWLVAAVALASFLEWWTYHRRWTV